jgi:hypothetical protein
MDVGADVDEPSSVVQATAIRASDASTDTPETTREARIGGGC